MNKILNFFLYALVVTQLSCSIDNKEIYIDQVNEDFMQQAKTLFGGKTYDLQSFSSYNSNMVFYSIKKQDFEINSFMNDYGDILMNLNWLFQNIEGGGYIFCNGVKQMEIIPPKRNILINEIDGVIGKQLDDEWNIVFYKPNNSTSNFCYKYHEVTGIE